MIRIYTDGACFPNPGSGGWAYVIPQMGIERSGHEPITTNNRMEMMAAVIALEELAVGSTIELTTDSQYLRLGITKWISAWRRRSWKTREGADVKNRDLWERLLIAERRHQIRWLWVRGHSGNEHNERCDVLAGQASASGVGI